MTHRVFLQCREIFAKGLLVFIVLLRCCVVALLCLTNTRRLTSHVGGFHLAICSIEQWLPEMTKRLFNGSTIPSGIAFLGLHLMVEGAMTLRGAK